MAELLQVKIASPEGLAYQGAAAMVELQTTSGVIQVLPGHVHLVTMLEPGDLILVNEGNDMAFAVGGGFAFISAESVTVLSDFAENEDSFLAEDAERARARAEEAMLAAPELSEEERGRIEGLITRASVEAKLKKRRQDRKGSR
jgi:F-type H+-transporting ATPase subunit epsilon